MKKEMRVALNQLLSEGECMENIFARLYMVAGYPEHCDEESFCSWLSKGNPTNDEIINFFIK